VRGVGFLHCALRLMLQTNSESKSVRNHRQRHYQSRKEECGFQLPRQEPGMVGLFVYPCPSWREILGSGSRATRDMPLLRSRRRPFDTQRNAP